MQSWPRLVCVSSYRACKIVAGAEGGLGVQVRSIGKGRLAGGGEEIKWACSSKSQGSEDREHGTQRVRGL